MENLRQATFRELRPICAQLLPLRTSCTALTALLEKLLAVLNTTSPVGLASCLDYVLFPLLFLVDSICAVRGGAAPGREFLALRQTSFPFQDVVLLSRTILGQMDLRA